MKRTLLFAAVSALALGATALAQDAKDKPAKDDQTDVKPLTIGDAARPIDISHWIKGDKVTEFEPGKVYVLEFWATWCPPCRDSMPHLTKLQQEYKDYGVTFISVSDEPLKTVKDFLPKKAKDDKTWDETIGYTLTTDPDKSVKKDYLVAANQKGIPCAFIIGKDSHVEWIGNPHPESGDDFDKALDAVAKGTWDRTEFKAEWEKEQAANRKMDEAQRELRTAIAEKNWDRALEILDEQIEASDGDFGPKYQKFVILLTEADQPDKAYALGEELIKQVWDEAQPLNQIAWFVVDAPTVKTRNLDFALKTAERAYQLTNEKDGAIIDTLARVYYEKGDLKNAVRLQKKAVEFAPADNPEMAEQLKTTLKQYEDELANKGG